MSKKVKDRFLRALTQRLYLIHREKISPCEMKFAVLGNTGNVYHVVINQLPKCNCPDNLKGNFCKHIIFVLCRVLKVDPGSPIVYQQALLKSELQHIFENAPPDPSITVKANLAVQTTYMALAGKAEPDKEEKIKRKPISDKDECSICCEALGEKELTVWCQGQCGNNFHQDCFNQWSRSSQNNGQDVTCPLCRILWVKQPEAAIEVDSFKDDAPGTYTNLSQLSGQDPNTYYDPQSWRGGRKSNGKWRPRY